MSGIFLAKLILMDFWWLIIGCENSNFWVNSDANQKIAILWDKKVLNFTFSIFNKAIVFDPIFEHFICFIIKAALFHRWY